MLALLVVGALLQGYQFLRSKGSESLRVWKTLGQSRLWRSGNYASGRHFADFVVFLNETIPEEARVALPPQSVGQRLLGHTPFMQYFLLPREVINCPDPTPDCLENLAQTDSYIVISNPGFFPGADMEQYGERLVMFDEEWGVLAPEGGAVESGWHNSGFSSLWNMAVGMLLPGVWLLALALPGWFLTSRILPRWGLAAQLLAGACIGLGVNSFLLFLGLLFTGFLSVGLILGTTALWWALAWVVAARFTAKLPVVRQAVRFDLWQAVILGMGMLAAYLAIGKSYFASDSIVIWANKGYAIAAHGLAQGVSVWGLGSWKYTLNIPISIAAFQTLFGDLHPFSKIMYPVFYLALLLGMYEFLRRVVQPAAAGLAVIAFGTSPFIFFHSQVGYANLAFTAYYVLGTLLALQVFNGAVQAEYQKPQLALAGLLFALGAWSRAEGLPIGLALIALLALYGYLRWGKGWLGKAVWLALPLMGLALVWLPASNMIYTLPRNNTGAFSTAIQQTLQGNINLEEMGYAARSFAASLADWGLWGLAGLGALGLSWLPLRDKDKQDYSGVVLWTGGGLVLLVAFGTIYATTYGGGCDVSCWVNSGLNRYIMPGVALLWVEGIRKVFRVGE